MAVVAASAEKKKRNKHIDWIVGMIPAAAQKWLSWFHFSQSGIYRILRLKYSCTKANYKNRVDDLPLDHTNQGRADSFYFIFFSRISYT